MKKFLIVMTSVLVALAFAMPAGAADFKMTWKGYMDVTGYSVSAAPQDAGVGPGLDRDSTNSWYQQELVIEPVFHINDKIRIHNKITIMERNWGGTSSGAVAYAPGTLDAPSGGNIASTLANPALGPNATGGSIGEEQSGAHNFWWEQCYLSFPLFGGTMSVGRMGGGRWGTLFMDDDDNRDRIKYVRKFGHIVVLGVIEKLEENDGGNYLGITNVTNPNAHSDSDVDAYAVGAIIPFSKNIVYKPLLYFVDYGSGSVTAGNTVAPYPAVSFRPFGAERWLFLQELMFKVGPFKFDAEVIYVWGDQYDRNVGGTKDREESQWLWWAEGIFTFGPAEIALGHFFLQGQGDDGNERNPEVNSVYGTGNMWEPLLIMFSNDIGIYNDSMGVINCTNATVWPPDEVALTRSGFVGWYLRGAYKISDAMKLSAIFGMVEADEMHVIAGQNNGRTPDKELGQEFDIQFDWKFLPNLTYSAAFGYMWTGDYYDDTDGQVGRDLSNNIYAFMHKLTIEW
jgi:hypothetical protein